MRRGTDILITALLAVVLVWCGLLFLGAFSQHRLTSLLNCKVLSEIKASIQDQAKGAAWTPDPKALQEIERLEKAQKELLDSNTVSFLFTFITLFLLTIGSGILGLMHRQYRRAQERAEKAEARIGDAWRALPLFMKGVHTAVVVATKYVLGFTLSRFYDSADIQRREDLCILMSDYLSDIRRHLKEAVQEKEGLEPQLHGLAMDMAERVDLELREIAQAAQPAERASMEQILTASKDCRRILWDHGIAFRNRYDEQFKKICWEEPDPLGAGNGGGQGRGCRPGRLPAGRGAD